MNKIAKLCTSITLIFSLAQADPDSRWSTASSDGYTYAVPGIELEFPRDHASHPDFKTEWWYITGHLESADSALDLGFQITFFRSAQKDSSNSKPSQIYMAHAAVVDKNTGKFKHEERLNSELWNAAAATDHLDVYNGNWYLRMDNPNTEAMKTRFSVHGFGSFHLNLSPAKPRTLFGDAGFSRKGDELGAASYYITFTRLAVQGTILKGELEIPVSGVAWMDHEFSSSQLTEEQVGWNWSSLILDDGSELMAYVMRRKDGAIDPHSRLTLISPDGEKTEFAGSDFSWVPTRYWESPETSGRYPVEYQISWGEGEASGSVKVTPVSDDQELRGRIGGFVYWEGACRVTDDSGKPIGLGFTELTGYTESLYGKF